MIPSFWKIPKNCLTLSQLLLGPTLILEVKSCPLSMSYLSSRPRSVRNLNFLALKIKIFYYSTISRFREKSSFRIVLFRFPPISKLSTIIKNLRWVFLQYYLSTNLSGHIRHYFFILYGFSKVQREKKFSHGCMT